MFRTLILLTMIASSLGLCAHAEGQLILDFSQTANGGVRVVGSGSGTTSTFGYSSEWRTLDYDKDFLSATLPTGFINADSVTRRITNTWGWQRQINSLKLGRSANSNDDTRFTFRGAMFFWVDQPYSISIEAIVNPTTLSYHDLVPGNYLDTNNYDSTEVFGRTRVNFEPIPEPHALGLMVAVAGMFSWVAVSRNRNHESHDIVTNELWRRR